MTMAEYQTVYMCLTCCEWQFERAERCGRCGSKMRTGKRRMNTSVMASARKVFDDMRKSQEARKQKA